MIKTSKGSIITLPYSMITALHISRRQTGRKRKRKKKERKKRDPPPAPSYPLCIYNGMSLLNFHCRFDSLRPIDQIVNAVANLSKFFFFAFDIFFHTAFFLLAP